MAAKSIKPATRGSPPRKSDIALLARYFNSGGYVRWQIPDRLEEGSSRYKKGNEVRLMAYSAAELKEIRRLLLRLGFRPGSPFEKHSAICQPLYGMEAVARFLALVGFK